MTELIRFINAYQELDSEKELAIKSYFKKVALKKNEFLIQEGDTCSKVWFIESGLIRRFYVKDGLDITEWIYHSNQWVTSLSSFIEQKPSFEYLEVCEETVLYSLPYQDEQKLLEYPLFSKFQIKQLRLYLSKLNEFHHIYKLMGAHEKYTYLITYFPEIIQ